MWAKHPVKVGWRCIGYNPRQSIFAVKKACQELQVTVTVTAIERSDIWCGQDLNNNEYKLDRWKARKLWSHTDLHSALQSWCLPINTFNSN